MKSALIGYTGFVGSNLLAQRNFDSLFNSKNILEIRNQEFDLLVCSAMPAAKWIANKEPENDLKIMQGLLENLKAVTAKKLILISTVDVYPIPKEVDEKSPIDQESCHAYGRHRLMFEEELKEHFEDVLIIRLPALFGKGLKKNAVYDFLHDNDTHKIHSQAKFQFYNLDYIWRDIQKAMLLNKTTINFATQPISIAEVAEYAFGIKFDNAPFDKAPSYNFLTEHLDLCPLNDGYLYSKEQILDDLKSFVKNYPTNELL